MGKKNWFAVVRGRKPGIYERWSECEKQVKRFSGNLYKGFATEEAARKYLNDHGIEVEDDHQIGKKRKRKKKKKKPIINDDESDEEEDEPPKKKRKVDNVIHIYTDGGCESNGTDHARAGIGVYFGKGDEKNISRRLYGKGHTNNTAELIAIIEALKAVRSKDDVMIHTDSELAINGIRGSWKVKKNLELFDEVKKLIKERKGKASFNKVKGHSGEEDG